MLLHERIFIFLLMQNDLQLSFHALKDENIWQMDLSTVETRPVTSSLDEYNIQIKENHGLDQGTGFWWLKFTFDYELEKDIEVRLTNFKYHPRDVWTLEVAKCNYLGITNQEKTDSFDMEDELVNNEELRRLNECIGSQENLRKYLGRNILPLVMKKIKYTRFLPQFSFFLSHNSENKPLMRTFRNGLKFLGYQTWLDEEDMPVGGSQGALKVAIEKCDCFVAWLNQGYFENAYRRAELSYAQMIGKIILPFGVHCQITEHLTGEFEFLAHLNIFNTTSSFFEILRRIDESLFNFESLTK